MSRISAAALALSCAAVGFVVGSYTGLFPEQPRATPTPTPQAASPPPPAGASAEVQRLLANPDPLERASEIARLLQRLGPESIDEVKAAYDAAFIEAGDPAIALLAEWWARLDPPGAFEWTQREPMGKTPAATAAVVRAWAARDPEEAARAIEGITNPELRRTSVGALVRGWNDSGTPGLTAYLSALPRGVERQRAISLAARSKVHREGVEKTFRWAEALPNDPDRFKLNVFRRVATWATEIDPHRAAAWAARHGGEEYGKGLFRRVGTRWAEQDGLAAMTWLATLPAGWERDVAVQETYRVWLGRDHDVAMAWLRGTQAKPWLEPALALYAKALARENPEQALEWAALIHDAERRREAIIKIGQYWHHVDPDAARAWLDRSGLPEEDRQWILEPPRAPRGRRELPRQGDVPGQQDVPSEEAGDSADS